MTTLPAVVRIVDLPVATTIVGTELLEIVQTASGVGLSVQITLANAVAPLGVLPTSGGTSQILAKSSGSNYSTAWYDVTSFIAVNTTSLATTGSGTALVIGVKTAGIGSAQIATFAVGSTQLNTSAVLRANLTAVAIGSAQLDVAAVQRTNITSFAVGSAQIDTASIGTAHMVAGAIGMTLLNTLTPSGVASTNDTTSITTAYRNYMVTFESVTPATNTTYLVMQVATSGANWTTSGYSISQNTFSAAGVAISTAVLITGNSATTSVSSSAGAGVFGSILLLNPAGSGVPKMIAGNVGWLNAPANLYLTGQMGGSINNSFPIVGINFLFNSGNIASGTIKIYGMP